MRTEEPTKLYKLTFTLTTPLADYQLAALLNDHAQATNPTTTMGFVFPGRLSGVLGMAETYAAQLNGVDFKKGEGTRMEVEEVKSNE